ncbi:hypothetical protein HK405_014817 [Cladochytrium tenue]|nr:hypothetical protein HK405_014817 [Cladochytrium tenue]
MRDLAQTVAPALLAAALRAPTEALLRPALGPPPPATAAAVLPFAVVAAFSLAGLLLGRGQQRHATGGGGSLAAAAVATATVPAAAVALGRAYASVRGLTGIPLAGFFVVAEAVLVAGPVACVRPRLPGAAALAAVAAAAMAVAAAAGDWVSGGDVLSWFLLPAHPAVMLVFVIGCACMALDAMIGGVGDGVGKTSAKSATVRGRRSKGSKAQANRTPASAAEHTRSWVSRRAWYLVSWVVLALLTIGAMPQFRPFLLPQVNSDGVRLVARSWSTTGLVSVVEDPRFHGGVRLLRCDHSVLGGVYTRPGTGYQGDSVYDVFYLLEFARAAIRNGAPKNALLIGLGTGIAAVELSRANISVVAVELDPAVARYAQEYFGVGVGGPASVTVIVGDGGAALEECAAGRYDLVVHDVFSNGGLPARLFSEAAMRAALRCLREGGVLALVRDLSNRFVSGFIKSNTELTVRRLFLLQNIVGSIRSPLAAHVLETLEKNRCKH